MRFCRKLRAYFFLIHMILTLLHIKMLGYLLSGQFFSRSLLIGQHEVWSHVLNYETLNSHTIIRDTRLVLFCVIFGTT